MVFVGDGVLLIMVNIIFASCNDIHNFTMFCGAQPNLHITSTIYMNGGPTRHRVVGVAEVGGDSHCTVPVVSPLSSWVLCSWGTKKHALRQQILANLMPGAPTGSPWPSESFIVHIPVLICPGKVPDYVDVLKQGQGLMWVLLAVDRSVYQEGLQPCIKGFDVILPASSHDFDGNLTI